MAIGVLAIIIGAVFSMISAIGIGTVQPPEYKNKKVEYPYPKEI